MTNENTFGKRLRTLRLTNGLTVEQASRNAGVSRTAWINWERGSRVPLLGRAGAIARAVGEPVAALFTDAPVMELVLSEGTVEEIRKGGREANSRVSRRLAVSLEPELWRLSTRVLADPGPNRRPKPRRSRAQVLAGIREAERIRLRKAAERRTIE